MHRLNPLCFMIVASLASALPASAEVLVGWGESPTNGGTAEVTSACLSNAGSHTLVVSLVVFLREFRSCPPPVSTTRARWGKSRQTGVTRALAEILSPT